MKKVPFLLLLVVLVCVSCSKGNKTVLKASFQRYQGSDAKAVLTGENYLMWTSGDLIRINNTSVQINGDGSDAVFEMEESLNGYAAFFPYTAVSSNINGDDPVRIKVPGDQAYVTYGAKQVINAPMAAYSASSTGNVDLMFSNLCSLIKVSITNTNSNRTQLLHPISVYIYNDNCILSGVGVVSNLSSSPTLNMESNTEAGTQAALAINDVSILRGGKKDFYIVVPPIENADNLEVGVYYYWEGSVPQVVKVVYKLANGSFTLEANKIAIIDFKINQ